MTDMTFYFCPFKPNFRIYFLILLLTWGAWCGEADDDLEWGPQWRVEPARHGDTGLHNSFPGFRMLIIPFVTGNISRYRTRVNLILSRPAYGVRVLEMMQETHFPILSMNSYNGQSISWCFPLPSLLLRNEMTRLWLSLSCLACTTSFPTVHSPAWLLSLF